MAKAAMNDAEMRCLSKAELLLSSDHLWGCIPNSGLTIESSCLAYRMLDRLACGVH